MHSILSIFPIILWVVTFGINPNPAIADARGKSVALVIGNTNYMQLPRLKNASNDALSVARALSNKGFTVFLAQDVTTRKLKQTLAFVAKQAADADRIVIYYAGHSEIKEGTAYLLSVDREISPSTFDTLTVTVNDLMEYFDIPFAQKAIILDACLETAVDVGNTGSQVLFLPKALGLETLLVFATSFGHAAYDGSGVHSVFTGALLDHIAKNEFDLQKTLQTVRREVVQSSRLNQIPVSISTLTQPYVFSTKNDVAHSFQQRNNLVQSYSNSGYAGKPLLDTLSVGIRLSGF